jgi:peptidoglycan/xylan/chitin deacetylase (PgdA/CDA1 family)
MIANNDRLVYEAMPSRPQVTWPEGKTLAFWHAPNVEHYDYIPPGGGSPQGRTLAPDVQHYMHRDAGNRATFWRMLRAVDRWEMPSTVSLSLAVLEEIPEVRDAMIERDWEVMSHGISNLRTLYDMPAEEEDAFYALNQRLAETYYGGRRIKGMLGPKISGTDNTCDLMAKHGMIYHTDWVHDEQPRPLRTAGGEKLVSVPYSFMVNDVPFLFAKNFSGDEFVAMAKNQITRLLNDSDDDGQGRVSCLATHPFVLGQPNMQRYLEQIFEFVRNDDRIWVTRAGDIAEHYIDNHYDEQLAHADQTAALFQEARA